MKFMNLVSVCAIAGLAVFVTAHAASPNPTAEVGALAKSYVSAQFSFDQVGLRKATAAQFVEVSPKGEVDEHDAVISFYDPGKRSSAPPFSIENQKVRFTGGVAVVTQTVNIGVPPRSMVFTQVLTATRIHGAWKLLSSQTTPVPSQRDK